MGSPTPIRRLPPTVVAQLTSSVTINSLTDVVLELVKNSLDAAAGTVSVTVDFARGGCTVEDDGHGIVASEFGSDGRIAVKYYTSKYPRAGDVHYGGRGDFLACLVSLALVAITSRTSPDKRTNTLIFHRAELVSRLVPAPPQHDIDGEHGTRVTVSDLFGHMPVRVKQRAAYFGRRGRVDEEWTALRLRLLALLIAYARPVKLILVGSDRSHRMTLNGHLCASPRLGLSGLDGGLIASLLSQSGLADAAAAEPWVPIRAHSAGVAVDAMVSLRASPSRQLQFVSLGIHPLLNSADPSVNFVHDLINQVFASSSFGRAQEDANYPGRPRSASTSRPSTAMAVDRWPKYICRIGMHDAETTIADLCEGEALRPDGPSLATVLDLLRAAFSQFLRQHHFLRDSGDNQRSHPSSSRSGDAGAKRQLAMQTDLRPRTSPCLARGVSAFRRGRCTSQHAEGPPMRARPQRTTDFAMWSRVKASRPSETADLKAGLPRAKRRLIGRADDAGPLRGPAESEALLGDHEPVDTQGEETAQPFVSEACASTHQEHAVPASSEVCIYTDPITLERIFVNSRTGQSLPSRPATAPSFSAAVMKRRDDAAPTSTAWIDGILKTWRNPCIRHGEQSLRSLSPAAHPLRGTSWRHTADCRNCSSDMPNRPLSQYLTKARLKSVKLIAQVDEKFLLVKMHATSDASHASDLRPTIVLIDQHAADERVRVEELFRQLTSLRHDLLVGGPARTGLTELTDPIAFPTSLEEAALFKRYREYFALWGCEYSICQSKPGGPTVTLQRLPSMISERCRLEPRLAIDMLRSGLWARHERGNGWDRRCQEPSDRATQGMIVQSPPSPPRNDDWVTHIADCPKSIVDMLNSRACRSAIMFNDALSRRECLSLLRRLAECAFPFQCAHGRPSMVPLVNLGSDIAATESAAA
ncbi:DNA mismatch repair protein [Ascosphaera acerosa]|nr:DNA mismatch repair protein [Ascosphaera acerosa]